MTSLIRSRDSSSDSEVSQSEWAIVDEDSSLEWNDEAKYHFRSKAEDVAAHTNDVSDEESIEVVSDVDFIEAGEDDQEDNQERDVAVISSDDHTSEDCESTSNMVWYRLKDSKSCHKELKSHQPATHLEHVTAVNPRDNWDLIVILVVALIGGIALGYFWGLRHEHATSPTTLTTKLQFENHLLRHKLRCMHLTLQHRIVMPDTRNLGVLQQLSVEPRYDIPPIHQVTKESLPQELFSQNEAIPSILNDVDGKASCDAAENMSPMETVPCANGNFESNVPIAGEVLPDITSSLHETVLKIFALLPPGSKFFIDTNNSLSVGLQIIENISKKLKTVNSIQQEKILPTLYPKFTSIKSQTQKASNKLVNKVDKYLNKMFSKILHKLQKFMLNNKKHFCNLKQIIESGNSEIVDWPEEMAGECSVHYGKNVKVKERRARRRDEIRVQSADSEQTKPSVSEQHGGGELRKDNSGRHENGKQKDDLFTPDLKASNVSGDWVMEMARGRAQKRESDHQSDWLFDRASARKCHRGEFQKDKQEKKSSHWNDNFFERNMKQDKPRRKKFQKMRKILNDVFPESFSNVFQSMESAFKEMRNKMKPPSRE